MPIIFPRHAGSPGHPLSQHTLFPTLAVAPAAWAGCAAGAGPQPDRAAGTAPASRHFAANRFLPSGTGKSGQPHARSPGRNRPAERHRARLESDHRHGRAGTARCQRQRRPAYRPAQRHGIAAGHAAAGFRAAAGGAATAADAAACRWRGRSCRPGAGTGQIGRFRSGAGLAVVAAAYRHHARQPALERCAARCTAAADDRYRCHPEKQWPAPRAATAGHAAFRLGPADPVRQRMEPSAVR